MSAEGWDSRRVAERMGDCRWAGDQGDRGGVGGLMKPVRTGVILTLKQSQEDGG